MNTSNESGDNIHTKSVPSVVYNSIGISMSVLFVLALLENIFVLVVYKSNKKLQSTTNLWIIAVIVCDLLIVLNAFPFVTIASFSQSFIFGTAGCKWDGFIITVLGTSSIFLLTGLSIHRYIIMIHNSRRKLYERTYIIYSIVACFCFGFFWGITPLIGWGSFAPEGINISCAPNWRSHKISDVSYQIAMYVSVLFLPLVTMAYCYICILFKIWREKQNHSHWIRQRRVKRDIRVTISVALTIVSFLVSWTPYAVVSLLESFFNMDLFTISPMLVQLPCLMAKTACIWNPLVYVCHNNQFRAAFRQRFESLKRFKTESRGHASEVHDSTESPTRISKNVVLLHCVNTNSYKSNICKTAKCDPKVKPGMVTQTLSNNLPKSKVRQQLPSADQSQARIAV